MYRILITTSNDKNILKTIAKDCIVNKNISPCAHLADRINSLYVWDDDFICKEEYILAIKCEARHVDEISNIINEHHNYDVPEIISFNFNIVSDQYKEWFIKK